MSTHPLLNRDFSPEFIFNASRSSGAGGQNVNKVNTKVELRFQIDASQVLTEQEKEIIKQKLFNRINEAGELVLTTQTERSQLKNKEKVIEKFYSLVEKALTPKKKRKPTKPTAASKAKRVDDKRKTAQKKSLRKNINENS
jgi:ribosome-associated protein